MTTATTIKRSYVADLEPDEYGPLSFNVIYDPSDDDQPWCVSSDIGWDTHHTLESVLFWELWSPGYISDEMRKKILNDFGIVTNA